jgi:hypothetical protein
MAKVIVILGLVLLVALSPLQAQVRVTTEDVPRLIEETEKLLSIARARNEGAAVEISNLKERVAELQELYHSLESGTEDQRTCKSQLVETAARVLYARVGVLEGKIEALNEAEGNLGRLYDVADRLGEGPGKGGSGKGLVREELQRDTEERRRIDNEVDRLWAMLEKIPLTSRTRQRLEVEYRAKDRWMRGNVDKRDRKLRAQMAKMGESYKLTLVSKINSLRSMLEIHSDFPFQLASIKAEARLMLSVLSIEELTEATVGLTGELAAWKKDNLEELGGDLVPLEVYDPPEIPVIPEVFPEEGAAYFRSGPSRSR